MASLRLFPEIPELVRTVIGNIIEKQNCRDGPRMASWPGFEKRLLEAGLHGASCMFTLLRDDLPCSFTFGCQATREAEANPLHHEARYF